VSANLAVALAKLGARVGLMDADVSGPTIPTLMGAGPAPAQRTPAVSYGVKIMSMGFFVPKGEATIWRGPMLSKVVDQFLGGVEWGEPIICYRSAAGHRGCQLSLCQKIPLTGAVIVSTRKTSPSTWRKGHPHVPSSARRCWDWSRT
jgi:ATP-binding protein involved in chromosome partitioning